MCRSHAEGGRRCSGRKAGGGVAASVRNAIQSIKDKVEYEKESFRLSGDHLKKVDEEFPFPKFSQRIHMTEDDLAKWRREQRKKARETT